MVTQRVNGWAIQRTDVFRGSTGFRMKAVRAEPNEFTWRSVQASDSPQRFIIPNTIAICASSATLDTLSLLFICVP